MEQGVQEHVRNAPTDWQEADCKPNREHSVRDRLRMPLTASRESDAMTQNRGLI